MPTKKIKLTVSLDLVAWGLLRRMSEDRRQASGDREPVNRLICEAIGEFLDSHGYRPLKHYEDKLKGE
jgi:hypothetical protein